MSIVCELKFGSHLYGTNTELSDTDYKGVFIPSPREILLQKAPKTLQQKPSKKEGVKNTSLDIDRELYSLHYFLNLGYEGDTTFLDMIHVNKKSLIQTSDVWEYLVENRSKFYTKNLKSYLGYCRTQAAKYGVKGSRAHDAKKVYTFLLEKADDVKLMDYWEELPQGENIKKWVSETVTNQDPRVYEVCNRKIMAGTRTLHAREIVKNFYDNYGARARQAEENSGIDWKAISHAFRAGYQLKEIYMTGDLQFPLINADYLRDIKQGKYHYKNDQIGEKLTSLIDEVEELSKNSSYPEKVDREFFDTFLEETYKKRVVGFSYDPMYVFMKGDK